MNFSMDYYINYIFILIICQINKQVQCATQVNGQWKCSETNGQTATNWGTDCGGTSDCGNCDATHLAGGFVKTCNVYPTCTNVVAVSGSDTLYYNCRLTEFGGTPSEADVDGVVSDSNTATCVDLTNKKPAFGYKYSCLKSQGMPSTMIEVTYKTASAGECISGLAKVYLIGAKTLFTDGNGCDHKTPIQCTEGSPQPTGTVCKFSYTCNFDPSSQYVDYTILIHNPSKPVCTLEKLF